MQFILRKRVLRINHGINLNLSKHVFDARRNAGIKNFNGDLRSDIDFLAIVRNIGIKSVLFELVFIYFHNIFVAVD